MQRFIMGRVLLSILTLVALSVIIFVVSRVAGDPVVLFMGVEPGQTQDDIDRLRRSLGLDEPMVNQYWIFAKDVVRGDLGDSLRTDRPVLEMMGDRFPATLKLAGVTAVIAIPLGLLLGVMAAIKRDRPLDVIARIIAVLGQSLPSFWVGIMLILFFSVEWRFFPAAGLESPKHYVLPVITLGMYLLAALTRLTRSSMLEVLGSDFVTFARARGTAEHTVIFKHALKNAAIPILTLVAILMATMVTGSVVVETVFAWPGLGRLAYDSIVALDFPVIQAIVLFYGAMFVGANLLSDILYVWLDPRIRYA